MYIHVDLKNVSSYTNLAYIKIHKNRRKDINFDLYLQVKVKNYYFYTMEKRIPQYRILYELLRKHIEEGVYKEGDLLPSENDLCQIHQVTRPTVRQALTALVNDGFIKKQQGKGSIVNNLPMGIGILSVTGTTSAIGSKDLKTEIMVKPTIRNWKEPFMYSLSDIEKESGCIYFERLRLLEDRPVFYDITYLPNINLPRFTSLQLTDRSLFSVLRKNFGLEVTGGEQRLRAISADKRIAGFLKIDSKKPVLNIDRKIATNRPGFYFYSRLYCNTEISPIFGIF